MKIELILAIIALTATLTAIILGAKLIQAKRPVIINCEKPIISTSLPDRNNIWEVK